jgi:hypothetical protein
MGYPTATRLAPAHAVLERRGNDGVIAKMGPIEKNMGPIVVFLALLMLPPRGFQEVAWSVPAPRDSELCLPLQLQLVINSSSSSASWAYLFRMIKLLSSSSLLLPLQLPLVINSSSAPRDSDLGLPLQID